MPFQFPETARLAGLVLRARDLEAMLAFYRDLLGLSVTGRDGEHFYLALPGAEFELVLQHRPSAPLRPHPSVGLYHFALLSPDRPSLAAVLRRILDKRWDLEGASDHGVSEALYLRDPEGNGLELYRDRPHGVWPYQNDELTMVTAPLDIEKLLRETPATAPLHPGTRLGHIHLHVSDLRQGETFYADGFGLRVTQRSYPGALFLAAGNYHHHLGLNTWARGRRAPAESTGLLSYTWALPEGTLEAFKRQVTSRGVAFQTVSDALSVIDPFGITVVATERVPLKL